MGQSNVAMLQFIKFFIAATVAAFVLAGCEGDDGKDAVAVTNQASSLAIEINSVTVSSPPVVNFSVTNESGIAFGGLTTDDLRFTIAKLSGGSWQNYINTEETAVVGPGSGNTAIQATRENNGTLAYHPSTGEYSYTFATDITNVIEPLEVAYDPSLTHRLAIQTRGSLPMVNAVYTFRPSDGATEGIANRKLVNTETCNECHNKLELHDARIEVDYCVVCHNPGSTDANSGNTVDFKVMVHKIHRGEDLPSVDTGGSEYSIYGFNDNKHDYSTVAYPQDIRNCAKCHQGNNWQTQPSMAACGSCHDDVDFVAGTNHTPGPVSDDSLCLNCHVDGGDAGSVADSHFIPEKAASAKFNYNILTICGTAVDANPDCDPNTAPVVTFSVSDPTGATTHTYGNLYDVAGATTADRDPEFGTSASLNILTAWNTLDYTNDDGSGSRPSRADSTNALTNATHVADGVFTITLDTIPASATGSGAIAIEGHPRGESDPGSGTFDINAPVKGAVAYFSITDAAPVPRRVAVDLQTKCDNCHDQLSLHGNNRAENAQLCVMCHNPRGTDAGRRPKDGDGMPDATATLDGKAEESIDFKRMIHAIHAGDADEHGFRENGIVIYGFGSNAHDYSHMRFPGILSDCETCHNEGTYELDGTWASPAANGILSSTILIAPDPFATNDYPTQAADQTNDEVISATSAVCSACHDGAVAQSHMEAIGSGQFNVIPGVIGTESCSICHGPGSIADVKVVHAVD